MSDKKGKEKKLKLATNSKEKLKAGKFNILKQPNRNGENQIKNQYHNINTDQQNNKLNNKNISAEKSENFIPFYNNISKFKNELNLKRKNFNEISNQTSRNNRFKNVYNKGNMENSINNLLPLTKEDYDEYDLNSYNFKKERNLRVNIERINKITEEDIKKKERNEQKAIFKMKEEKMSIKSKMKIYKKY